MGASKRFVGARRGFFLGFLHNFSRGHAMTWTLRTTPVRYVDIVRGDFAGLERAETQAINALFAPQACVDSPFLGVVEAPDFFAALAAASRRSIIRDAGIYVSAAGAPRAIAQFTYDWELAQGGRVNFRCAD